MVHDILSSKLFYPDFSTHLVSIDWENIGQLAAQLLIEQAGQFSLVPRILRVCPNIYKVHGKERILVSQTEK